MSKCWLLVADRAGARLFAVSKRGRVLEPLEVFEHPAGRLHDRDFGSDHPGRVYDSFGGGRHSVGSEESPSERVAQDFARSLAAHLEAGRKAGKVDSLVLIAEPRFLGRLRTALDDNTAALVTATLDSDLAHCSADELVPRAIALLASV